jgi:quinol-cytochrome oxidoreductase complex cytochrome b subunit
LVFANILIDLHQEKPPYNKDYTMSSIQIGALVYFTVIIIGAWIFFAVIFLQLKRFIDMSCYVPLVSKILTITLIILTVLGYIVIFSPNMLGIFDEATPKTPAKTSGYFDTY